MITRDIFHKEMMHKPHLQTKDINTSSLSLPQAKMGEA